jgi:diaminopimelate decarboxylase
VLLDSGLLLRTRHGLAIDEISPGGGLGVPYTTDQPGADIDAYVAQVARAVRDGCAARRLPLPKLVIEPGRSIVARAGVALYEIVATKHLPGDAEVGERTDLSPVSSAGAARYLHVDGGMADNIRPALYGARYTALLANRASEDALETVHIAGRFCESGDVLLRDLRLPVASLGDMLAVAVAGAYTLSMASNYNLVPRPALLLVGEGRARLIQRRETYADIAARDVSLT